MTETNEPLIIDIDLKESDLQRANFWFRLGKWSTRLLLAMLFIAGLLLLWRFQSSNLFENPPRCHRCNRVNHHSHSLSTAYLVSNETRFWELAGFPNKNPIFVFAQWLQCTGYQILRRYRLGRHFARRRIKTFVPSLLSQIVVSYNSQALLQASGRYCSSQNSLETCAGHEGNCFLTTCPTTPLDRSGAWVFRNIIGAAKVG